MDPENTLTEPQDGTNPETELASTPAIDPKKFDDLVAQKRAANREAQELKKQMAEMAAQLDSYKAKDMSDLEKVQSEAAKAKAQAAELASKLSMLESENLAIRSGAKDAELVAYKWNQHRMNDPEADPDAFIGALRESHPYLFADQPAPPTAPKGGTGGPPAPGSSSSKDANVRLAQINDEMNQLLTMGRGRDRNRRHQALLLERQKLLKTGG